jgi:hypothetical protein
MKIVVVGVIFAAHTRGVDSSSLSTATKNPFVNVIPGTFTD